MRDLITNTLYNLGREGRKHLSKCDECGEMVDEIMGCPDGFEICHACFDAGAH